MLFFGVKVNTRILSKLVNKLNGLIVTIERISVSLNLRLLGLQQHLFYDSRPLD